MSRLLIRDASIIDGTGNDPYNCDVLVKDGIIAEIGKLESLEADEILIAEGRCLTPGFIDIHRHADLQILNPEFGPAEIRQGITTCISGNCGMSAAPCDPIRKIELYNYLETILGKLPPGCAFTTYQDYAEKLSSSPLALNMGTYVGNGTIRIAVKGFDQSLMTTNELDRAKSLVGEAMQSGAMGLSMGIMFAPECSYTTDELVEIASEAGKYGGLLATHIRGEGDSMPGSVAEAINIAKRAEISLNISHFKAAGRNNWGKAIYQAIDLIEDARAKGQDVTCDVYPYEAGSSPMLTLIPPALMSDGVEKFLLNLYDKNYRDRLRMEVIKKHDDWDNLVLSLGWDRVVISSVNRKENKHLQGRSVAEIACDMDQDEIDCICDLLLSEDGKVGMVIFSMSLDDMISVMRLPYSIIISDALYPPSGNPHPRKHGAFSRMISEYVLRKGVLTLNEAIKKMTSLPASRMGLHNRGLVKKGYIADLLLFDPGNIVDTATYQDSVQLAKGMDLVIINGKAIFMDGVSTIKKNGVFIKRGA